MYDEYENLTPEERLDRIIEILTRWALRLDELKKKVNNCTDAIDRTLTKNSQQKKPKESNHLT